jgi:hypothetical protein
MINYVAIDSIAVRDLNFVGLLATLEGLNVRLCTTSTACDRSKFQTVPFTVSPCDEGGIYIMTLSTEEMEEVYEMSLTYSEITFTECTVLYMAAKYCQALVTADPGMMKSAAMLGIVVYGYEWVLDRMVDSGVISVTVAGDKYQELRTSINPVLFRDTNARISFKPQIAMEVQG